MRFYCVIKKCNVEKIKDFQSFRNALPRDISFYPETQKDQALEEAKRIANRATNNESFIVTVDLNKLLQKQALAQINGPSILETIMPYRKVDKWEIAKLSKNANNEWKIEKIKSGGRAHHRFNWSIAASVAVLGIGYFASLGFWPVVGLIALGAVTTTLINRCTDHYVKKYYKNADQIKAIQYPSEQEALWIGKESTSLLQSLSAFVKPVTWMHPLAYVAGKTHAINQNEKAIKVIESLHRAKP
jgi:hypothetical protein